MVDSTDPSTWVYDPRYDDVEKWYEADIKGLDPLRDGTIPDKPVGPVVTGSFGAWRRSVNVPNVGLIAHCQKFFVHDSAEARVDENGQMQVTCTCGLVVPINMDSDEESLKPGRYWPKYFAENHPTTPISKQRAFFEHPGHRDPLEQTVLGGFLVRLRRPGLDQTVRLELRCVTCGWRKLASPLSGDWDEFDKYHHRVPIDKHNIYCPQPGTDFWDGVMYLWGHGASAWLKQRESKVDSAFDTATTDDSVEPDEDPRAE